MIEAVNLAKGVRPPVDPYNLSFENPDCERDFLRLEYYMLAVFWQNRVLVVCPRRRRDHRRRQKTYLSTNR